MTPSRFLILAAALGLPLLPARAATAIDTVFGDATAPVQSRGGVPSPQVTGVFPPGWMEDSSAWTRVAVDCAPGQQDGFRFLRISTREVASSGRVQFCHLLPPAQKETFYRLHLRARAWNWTGPAGRVGIRHLHAPWDYVWSTSLPTGSGWTDVDARFELGDDPADIGLFIEATCPGSKLDLISLTLDEIPEASLRADADAAYPDHGPANLLRSSRFPLGLQSGWYIKREVSDQEGPAAPAPGVAFGGTWGNGTIQAQADEGNPGPTGSPALKIASVDGRGVTLSGEPFLPVYPFVGHAASFYAKGEGAWRCRVLVDGDGYGPVDGSKGGGGRSDVAAEFRFTPGADWKRIAVPFAPRKIAEGYRIEFSGAKTLWIDGLQAGPEEKAGAYASAGACEVALGLPKSDASDARIQFSDEPARIAWRVTGAASGVLKLSVTDLYGTKTALPDVPLGPDKPGAAPTADFSAALKGRPYGAFRIDARAEADGKPLSPPNELVVNRLPRPRYWGKDAPDSPFGVNMDAVARNILMAKAAGINWVRLHDVPYTWWDFLEPEKGRWNFYDGEIALFRKMGMKVLGEFGSAPRWASLYADTGKTTWDPTWDRWFQPKNPDDYAHYVATVAARYRGQIDAWDVWNEPWTFPFWAKGYDLAKPNGIEGYLPGPQPAADFAALMKTAYAAAHGVDAGFTILGFNTTGHPERDLYRLGGPEWTSGVAKAGGLSACDALCYHWYEPGRLGFPGDGVGDALEAAFGSLRRDGAFPKPVWMTEGSSGGNTPIGFGLARLSAFGRQADDWNGIADRTARYLLSMSVQGVSKWFLYDMSQYVGRVTPTYTVLLTPDGYLHPSGIAHAAFARLIEGAKFVRVREAAPGIYASLFREGGRAVVAITSREPGAAFRLPAIPGVQPLDLYGNPLPAEAPFAGEIVYLTAQGEAADRLEAALAPKP